uniref:Uncharacterized protein n=1 Tax=Buteo japonicus TaxID=224669 RepID=A0A8C0AW04_9AVES
MALSLALKVNHSLLRLDLDREPKKESVKSFIETQKALLAEIQNGCKRNFILAKEKEEKEQKLQQSASMPEITVTEPLEEDPTPTASENGDTEPAEDGDGGNNMTDSDSDTDEETDVGLEIKDLSKTLDRPPPLHIAEESQRDAGVGSPAISPASTPSQGNERRISVSSPGRGHKIFVVTRVESLPERATNAAPAAGLATPPAVPSIGSDPKQGDPAVCESSAHDTPLPNGLKMDFARALPEASSDGDGKMGSCAAEHELSCSKNEQELEELLLEASQDAGQEPL